MLNRKMSPEEAIERIEIILKNSKFTQADKLALKSAISALAYINQLEAEVERLEKHELREAMKFNSDTIKRCTNKAIKEFADRLKSRFLNKNEVITNTIDNLVKEMVDDEE